MSSRERRGKDFWIGIILMAAGLFFLCSKAVVSSSFYSFSIGGFSVSSGLVIIPLMFGVVWLICKPKSIFARILTVVGAVALVGAIILSIRITFPRTSLFDYVIMMMLIAIGIGMLLRSSFKDDDDDDDKK